MYPFEIYDGRNWHPFMHSIDYRYIHFDFDESSGFYPLSRKEFTQWFHNTYGMEFIFINIFDENNEKYFRILVLDETIQNLKLLQKDLQKHKISFTSKVNFMNEYDGTNIKRKIAQYNFSF